MTPDGLPALGTAYLLLPFLLAAMLLDVSSRRIPNSLVVVVAASGLLLGIASGAGSWMAELRFSFGGLLIGGALLLPLYALGGMGAGDVKLLAAVGTFLGPADTLLAGIVTLIAGGVLALVFVAWRSLGALPIASRIGLQLQGQHGDQIHIPYSIAIAAGSLMAVLQW